MKRTGTSTRSLQTWQGRTRLNGRDPIAAAVENAVAVTTSLAIEEAEVMRTSTFLAMLNVVRTALRSAPESNGQQDSRTRSVVVGVIRGASWVRVVTTPFLADVGEAVLKSTTEIEGDLGGATANLIQGSVDAAHELGIDDAWAAAAAARGALETAQEFDPESTRKVYRAISGSAWRLGALAIDPYEAERHRGNGLEGHVSRII
jgi:hypothetical protein